MILTFQAVLFGENSEMKYWAHETSIIDEDAVIGDNTHVWQFCNIMSDVRIGDSCNIGQNVFIESGVRIGNRVKIKNNIALYKGVICENDVFLGPNCVFTNVTNPRGFLEKKTEFKETLIKQGATIGANSTLICGHIIGRYAMVGAGSVVTHDVKDYELVLGNPARHAGYVCRCGERLKAKAAAYVCSCCKRIYEMKDNQIYLKE